MSVKKKGLYAGAVTATLLWGSAFPCVKVGYQWLGIEGKDTGSQMLFAGIRFLLAGLCVLFLYWLVLCLRRSKNQYASSSEGCDKDEKVIASHFKILMLLAITQTFLQYFFYYVGLAHVTGTKGSIMNSLGTLLTVIFGMIYFRTKPEAEKIVGVFLGLIGVMIVCFSGISGGLSLAGEGALFLSAVFIAIGNIVNKKAATGINPLLVTGFHLSVGGLMLLLLGVIMKGSLQITGVKTIFLMLYMVFISAAGFGIWSSLLKWYPVEEVAVFLFLTPVFGTILSGLVLGESLNFIMLIALVCVCIGIALCNHSKISEVQ